MFRGKHVVEQQTKDGGLYERIKDLGLSLDDITKHVEKQTTSLNGVMSSSKSLNESLGNFETLFTQYPTPFPLSDFLQRSCAWLGCVDEITVKLQSKFTSQVAVPTREGVRTQLANAKGSKNRMLKHATSTDKISATSAGGAGGGSAPSSPNASTFKPISETNSSLESLAVQILCAYWEAYFDYFHEGCKLLLRVKVQVDEYKKQSADLANVAKMRTKKIKIFGTSLAELAQREAPKSVPQFLDDMLKFLEKWADDTEGIFRISGSKVQIDSMKESMDNGVVPDFNPRNMDANTVSSLFKLYLRSLPDPVIPLNMYYTFLAVTREITTDPDVRAGQVQDIVNLIRDMPVPHRVLLIRIMGICRRVMINRTVTKMDATNIATVLGPNMVKRPQLKKVPTAGTVGGADGGDDDQPMVAENSGLPFGDTSIIKILMDLAGDILDIVNAPGSEIAVEASMHIAPAAAVTSLPSTSAINSTLAAMGAPTTVAAIPSTATPATATQKDVATPASPPPVAKRPLPAVSSAKASASHTGSLRGNDKNPTTTATASNTGSLRGPDKYQQSPPISPTNATSPSFQSSPLFETKSNPTPAAAEKPATGGGGVAAVAADLGVTSAVSAPNPATSVADKQAPTPPPPPPMPAPFVINDALPIPEPAVGGLSPSPSATSSSSGVAGDGDKTGEGAAAAPVKMSHKQLQHNTFGRNKGRELQESVRNYENNNSTTPPADNNGGGGGGAGGDPGYTQDANGYVIKPKTSISIGGDRRQPARPAASAAPAVGRPPPSTTGPASSSPTPTPHHPHPHPHANNSSTGPTPSPHVPSSTSKPAAPATTTSPSTPPATAGVAASPATTANKSRDEAFDDAMSALDNLSNFNMNTTPPMITPSTSSSSMAAAAAAPPAPEPAPTPVAPPPVPRGILAIGLNLNKEARVLIGDITDTLLGSTKASLDTISLNGCVNVIHLLKKFSPGSGKLKNMIPSVPPITHPAPPDADNKLEKTKYTLACAISDLQNTFDATRVFLEGQLLLPLNDEDITRFEGLVNCLKALHKDLENDIAKARG
eukprot:TRINITY_DN1357_c0_g1_i1.p1 TRINITY_DN1357_c0_g1~~TRINITY_DN1357_c0_g1_i1.p1  ORF type:complete len:1054 (-),score=250.01 TRINITY_DN1357_c0_g1_i1:128-3289(-)